MNDERIGKYRVHPIAAMFPLLDGQLYQEFKESIRTDGQIEPIIVQGDLLIDGRNRLRACLDLGIEPRIKEYIGTIEISRYITLKNLERRSLTPDQRASIVTKIHGWRKEEEGQERKIKGNIEGGRKAGRGRPSRSAQVSDPTYSKANTPDKNARSTSGQIATEAKVSRSKADQAIAVLKISPRKLDEVIAGTTTLHDASKALKLKSQKPKDNTKSPVAHRELELEFLERILKRITDSLEEAGARSPTHWNPDAVPKYALIRGLHEVLHEVEARLDKVQVKQNANRGHQASRQDKISARKPQGAKKDSPDDQENQFTNETVN